ncbi:hypothetical protein Golob_019664 [Gossypium lobatum]|uniref:MaoC-like domain-containing protein n=1 Tax=Gossypium lobatum TaxID=34289 RepID=A0A7J8L8A1_9ROSI|nr:hypothetical protein [Gossypium lobatum]
MFGRSSVLAKGSLLRYFSSSSSSGVLKIGDVLRQTRTFSNDDVSQYSKLSHDVNPLHFDSESARAAGFEDRLVHGLLVASLFPWIISSHFYVGLPKEISSIYIAREGSRY